MTNGWVSLQPATVGSSSGGSPVLLLDYEASSDLASSVSLTVDTWTDIDSNKSFIVTNASALVEIAVRGNILMGTSSQIIASRLVIDSGGTPIYKYLGGAYGPSGTYGNPLTGISPVKLSGLALGSHTVKVQMITNNIGQVWFCRPASQSQTEGFRIQVTQLP